MGIQPHVFLRLLSGQVFDRFTTVVFLVTSAGAIRFLENANRLVKTVFLVYPHSMFLGLFFNFWAAPFRVKKWKEERVR